MPLAPPGQPRPDPLGRAGRPAGARTAATELKPGTVFLVRLRGGRRVVVKRSDAPWAEACAAALGPLAGVRTVPARAIVRAAWKPAAALPFAGPGGEVVLVLPWVAAPTLARAPTPFCARALGRLWAFDVLIDNADRLVKGGNPTNVLVDSDGSLHAIDQRLGPAVLGHPGSGGATARNLARAATGELREEVAHALFADFRAEANVRVAEPAAAARAFAAGVVDGIRAIAALDAAALGRAVAASGAGRHLCPVGFAEILRHFREAAR